MITVEDLLNGVHDSLFIITDDKGNIVFPKDKQRLFYCKSILEKGTPDSSKRYYFYNKKWYDHGEFVASDGSENYVITYFLNVSKYIADEIELQTDYGTHLPNRSLTLKWIDQLIEESMEAKIPFAMGMADIDLFKRINDKYGHDAGDRVLERVSQIFASNVRQRNIRGQQVFRGRDIVGRYGGEEFLFALNGVTFERMSNKFEQIRRIVSKENVDIEGAVIPCPTISVGMYWVSPDKYVDVKDMATFRNEIITKCDKALYVSKTDGRNKVTLYENSPEPKEDRPKILVKKK